MRLLGYTNDGRCAAQISALRFLWPQAQHPLRLRRDPRVPASPCRRIPTAQVQEVASGQDRRRTIPSSRAWWGASSDRKLWTLGWTVACRASWGISARLDRSGRGSKSRKRGCRRGGRGPGSSVQEGVGVPRGGGGRRPAVGRASGTRGPGANSSGRRRAGPAPAPLPRPHRLIPPSHQNRAPTRLPDRPARRSRCRNGRLLSPFSATPVPATRRPPLLARTPHLNAASPSAAHAKASQPFRMTWRGAGGP